MDDIDAKVRVFLESLGGDIKEVSGILFVKFPDGKVWDMTPPRESDEDWDALPCHR